MIVQTSNPNFQTPNPRPPKRQTENGERRNPHPKTITAKPQTQIRARNLWSLSLYQGLAVQLSKLEFNSEDERTDRPTRIPSSVASPVTTHHAAKGSVFVNLRNGGNLKNWRKQPGVGGAAFEAGVQLRGREGQRPHDFPVCHRLPLPRRQVMTPSFLTN